MVIAYMQVTSTTISVMTPPIYIKHFSEIESLTRENTTPRLTFQKHRKTPVRGQEEKFIEADDNVLMRTFFGRL